MVHFEEVDYDAFIPKGELTWGYCDSIEHILELNQVVVVRVIAYRDNFDSVIVSVKAARTNEYEQCRESLRRGDLVDGTILAVSNDVAYVELSVEGMTAAAYVHMTEVSNNLVVTPALLREVLPKESVFTFVIKRFDDQHRVIELSRRRWLKENHGELEYSKPYSCRSILLENGRALLYGNELECRVTSATLGMGELRQVFVTKRGETERDLQVEL